MYKYISCITYITVAEPAATIEAQGELEETVLNEIVRCLWLPKKPGDPTRRVSSERCPDCTYDPVENPKCSYGYKPIRIMTFNVAEPEKYPRAVD